MTHIQEQLRAGKRLENLQDEVVILDNLHITSPVVIANSRLKSFSARGSKFDQPVVFENVVVNGPILCGRSSSSDNEPAVFHQGLRFSGCELQGTLDCDGVHCHGPVIWEDTTFKGAVELNHACFHDSWTLTRSRFQCYWGAYELRVARDLDAQGVCCDCDCTFSGASLGGFVFFQQAVFNGEANFSETNFEKEALFSEARFQQDAEFEKCLFEDGVAFEQAQFQRQANFKAVLFKGWADFTASQFHDQAEWAHAQFHSGSDFSKAVFQKADFHGCCFEYDWLLPESRFAGSLNLEDIQVRGRVNFRQVHCDSMLQAARSRFEDAFYAEDCRFQDQVNWQGAWFEKEAAFSQAQFSGGLAMSNTKFFALADFQQAVFEQEADFEETRFGKGALFEQARFQTQASFRKAAFAGPVNFQQALFKGVACFNGAILGCGWSADFRNITFSQEARFENTDFARDALFQGTVFMEMAFFVRTRFSGLADFQDTTFIEEGDFTNAYILKHWCLARANINRARLDKAQVRGRILSEQRGDYAQACEEYGLLKAIFEAQNKYDEMDWAYYKFKSCQRKSLGLDFYQPLKGLRRLGSWLFFDLGSGYGTKPLNISFLALLIVLFFGLVYWIFPGDLVYDSHAYSNKHSLQFSEAVCISFLNFLTMGMEGIHFNLGGNMKYVMMLEAFLGIFIMTLFVGTFTRKIIR